MTDDHPVYFGPSFEEYLHHVVRKGEVPSDEATPARRPGLAWTGRYPSIGVSPKRTRD